MNVIEQQREVLPIGIDPFTRIELIGKVCTKREDNITDTSAIKFFKNRMIDGHTAIAAHGVLYYGFDYIEDLESVNSFLSSLDNPRHDVLYNRNGYFLAINYRTIVDILNKLVVAKLFLHDIDANIQWIIKRSNILNILNIENEYLTLDANLDVSGINELTEEEILKDAPELCYISIKFTTDRGVSHEIVRHTAMSFMQESTRWCNYGNSGITFVRPYWMSNPDYSDIVNNNRRHDISGKSILNTDLKSRISSAAYAMYRHWVNTEIEYDTVLMEHNSAQAARAVLPNSTKTEIWVTAPLYKWKGYEVSAENYPIKELKGFIPQRTSKAAHPDMLIACRYIAESIKYAINEVGINPIAYDNM